jgi:hypothetical protein
VEHTDIAPLARRLAEENNVEWRRLRGSGERGRVVERDVLEYLARVMAGEEDLDPTPEPVPEGMQAWPDEDVRAFEQEKRGETVPPAYGTSTVDDEIFLLDGEGDDLDGELDVEEPEASYGAADYAADAYPTYARPDAHADDDVELAPMEGVIDDIVDEDDLLVAGDDRAQAETAAPTGDGWPPAGAAAPPAHAPTAFGTNDEDAELLPDLFDDRPSEHAWDDAPVFGDEGLGGSEPSPPGPSLDMDDDGDVDDDGVGAWGASDEGPSVFAHDVDAHAPGAPEPDTDAADPAFGAVGSDPLDFDGPGRDEAEPDVFAHPEDADEPILGAGADPVAEAPREDPSVEAEAADAQETAEEAAAPDAAGVDAAAPDDGAHDDLALEDLAPESPTPDDHVLDEATHEHAAPTDAATGDAAPPADAPHAVAEAPDDATSLGAAPVVVPSDSSALEESDARHEAGEGVAGSGGEGLPLVSHGAVFRRQVDLSNLVAAQGDVARDLGLDEPVPLIAFLARAAAKARGGGSAVGVAVFDDQAIRTVSVDVASGAFAEALAAFEGLTEAPDARGEDLDLIVADLADLDLDEAVLHLGAPVLAIGRVLIDTSTGGRRATLTLSGPGVGRDAAGILTRTAELLETPIRVVL